MSPLLVRAMRRATLYAGLLSLGLVLFFKVLPALGFLGPTAQEEIDTTARALETARVYGSEAGMAAFDDAGSGLKTARDLLASGHVFGARQAARSARAMAFAAQREALTRRENERRRAQQIVDEVDRLLSELEDRYSAAASGKSKEETSRLLAIMRTARQSGAALFLAFEQNNYRKVIAEEVAVTAGLAEARSALDAARRR
jgi:hypothetical protein